MQLVWARLIVAGLAAVVALVLVATMLVVVLAWEIGGPSLMDAQGGVGSCERSGMGGALQAGKVPAEYEDAIVGAAKASGIPAPLLAAQIESESGWNPKAQSPVGAQGIAQFMPGTWAQYGAGGDPFDGNAGIAAQGRFMKVLFDQATASPYGADPLDLAFAGYNAGWGAVQLWQGIPPYQETIKYVERIRSLAAGYASTDGEGVQVETSVNCEVSGGGGTTTGEDDYPYKDRPHCLLSSTGGYLGCPAGSESPLGGYNSECVDFVLWRVNQQLGSTKEPYAVTNGNFRGDGNVLGNAVTYLDGWKVRGWQYGKEPVVGAVTYYGATNSFASSAGFGHVGIVKEVYADGSFLEEGYNYGFPPNDHKYYTIKRMNVDPTMFLYLPGKGAKK